MKRFMQWVAFSVVACALAGCATTASVPAIPSLRLSPAALGHPLALQQRMTVSVRGQSQQLELALEVDNDSVRLAVLGFGQTVARLEWDGRTLIESRTAGWPEAVRAERILGDLQLVHWPVDVVSAALPQGWTLTSQAGERTLRYKEQPVVEVRFPSAQVAELRNLADGYHLRIESRPWVSP